MRHSERLGLLRWRDALAALLVAGGFTVIGIAGDTRPQPTAAAAPEHAGETGAVAGTPNRFHDSETDTHEQSPRDGTKIARMAAGS